MCLTLVGLFCKKSLTLVGHFCKNISHFSRALCKKCLSPAANTSVTTQLNTSTKIVLFPKKKQQITLNYFRAHMCQNQIPFFNSNPIPYAHTNVSIRLAKVTVETWRRSVSYRAKEPCQSEALSQKDIQKKTTG